MLDNLRRSLVAPASLVLLAFALASGGVSPWASFLLVAFAFSGGPLMGALAGLSPSRDDIARVHFYRQALADLGRALASAAWLLAQLLQLALMSTDAIVRALYRQFVSKRHLLEWRRRPLPRRRRRRTCASSSASTGVRRSRPSCCGSRCWRPGRRTPIAATLLCIVWALSPLWTWWVSRPRPVQRGGALSSDDRALLHDVARDTWRLFERVVGAEDNHLPPDNLQVVPSDMVAHRTSPTNIGLYLLSTACAQRFGWIGTVEMIERVEATLATLATAAAPSRPLPELVRLALGRGAVAAIRLDRRQRQPLHPPARARPGVPGAQPRAAARPRRCGAPRQPPRRGSPCCAPR